MNIVNILHKVKKMRDMILRNTAAIIMLALLTEEAECFYLHPKGVGGGLSTVLSTFSTQSKTFHKITNIYTEQNQYLH